MAASFGGVSSSESSFLGARQAGNLLTKASWWCGGLFLALSFLLALASTQSRAPKSILDQTFAPTPVTTSPTNAAPAAGGANPAIPLTPAPAANTPANAPATTPATTPPAGAKTAPATPPAGKKP